MFIRILSDAYADGPIFERELGPDEKSDGDNKTLEWNGETTDGPDDIKFKFINPLFSPYKVKLTSNPVNSNEEEFKVLCEWSINDFVLQIQNKMFDLWFDDNKHHFSKETFLSYVESNGYEFDENFNLI